VIESWSVDGRGDHGRPDGRFPRLSVRILLTELCNLACVFCHNEGQEGQQRILQVKPAYLGQILSELSSAVSDLQVKFSGGEPTSHPLIDDFLSSARDAGVSDIVVISNGTDTATFERLVGRHRLRVSLNVPAIDDLEYQRITGGNVQDVLSTARLLRVAGISTAFNTYWPTRRPAERLSTLIETARSLDVALKILTPCQVIDPAAQENAVKKIGEWLAARGFSYSREINHVTFYTHHDRGIRVQKPWCPVYCQALAGRDVTIRITADGGIRSCLRGGGQAFDSVEGSVQEACKRIISAMKSAGRECGRAAASPRIITRPRPGSNGYPVPADPPVRVFSASPRPMLFNNSAASFR
jgi:GTP 3',8-cyclase